MEQNQTQRPSPPSTPKKVRRFDVAHASMQASDTKDQVTKDVVKLFNKGYDWLTGTEAGEDPVQKAVRLEAYKKGYTFTVWKSKWVAVKRSLIKPDSLIKGCQDVVDNDKVVGPGHDLGFVWNTFVVEGVGRITVIGSHYATKGRPDAVHDPIFKRNLEVNRKLAAAIGDVADKKSEGNKLVFYGGDQNIVDRVSDTFMGEKLTSAWDELGKWENTGHDNIDVIASYDRDHRVKAAYIRALDDKEQFMFSDHFVVEAGFDVELLDTED